MKMTLKISLILNLALLAGMVLVAGRPNQRRRAVAAPLVAKVTTETPAPASMAAAPSSQQSESPPFRWSQLYTSDYHDYVKNLRGVGCPEATVRAIVTADVQAVFLFRANEIAKELSDFENSSWTNQLAAFQKETALKDELRGMPDAEAAEIADLLGLKPAPVQVAATAETAAQPSRHVHISPSSSPHITPASQPLVFEDVDLSALNLTEDQKQDIANLRQNFLQQIGGANQDPNDPAYLARWQQAQPAADDLLKAYLGADAYAQYEVLAAQKTFAAQYQSRGQQP